MSDSYGLTVADMYMIKAKLCTVCNQKTVYEQVI